MRKEESKGKGSGKGREFREGRREETEKGEDGGGHRLLTG